MEQVYKKGSTHTFHKKKDQNNYFRAEINKKWEKLLILKEKKSRLTFNNKNFFFSEIRVL